LLTVTTFLTVKKQPEHGFIGEWCKRRIKDKKNCLILFQGEPGCQPAGSKVMMADGSWKAIEDVRKGDSVLSFDNGVLVADLEASASRGISVEEARKIAMKFHIPAYIALGLDPKKTTFYFQSENKDVIHLAYEFSRKITLNEFRAIYGSADPGRIMSAVTQVGDVVFPQLKKKIPGIIPVGIDQDPHMRLSRDVCNRTKSTHKLFPPASIYHKFTPSLDGGMKMSKSKPGSHIELPEDPKEACKKIKKAVTGGRETLEEHRRLGAEVEKCTVFELLKQHLVEDDKELQKIHDEYKSGKMTSGEIKEVACEKMTKFMNDFNKKLKAAQKDVKKLKFISFS